MAQALTSYKGKGVLKSANSTTNKDKIFLPPKRKRENLRLAILVQIENPLKDQDQEISKSNQEIISSNQTTRSLIIQNNPKGLENKNLVNFLIQKLKIKYKKNTI